MYEGKITIPPHSTVELPLDNLLADALKKNNAAIANAKEINLANKKLRLKNADNAKTAREMMVRFGAFKTSTTPQKR